MRGGVPRVCHAARRRASGGGKSAVERSIPRDAASSSILGCRHAGIWFERPHELTVVIGTVSSRARSAIVPNFAMISDAVMPPSYDIRRISQAAITNCGVALTDCVGQLIRVLDTDELLARLDARGIRNIDIAKALGLPDSRVPEIKQRKRALKLDEGVKLIRTFGLEQDPPVPPLDGPVLRLAVRYIAEELGASVENGQLQELIEDVRAFSSFVADPSIRRSVEAAEGFFQALRLRRPESEREAQPGSDPVRSN